MTEKLINCPRCESNACSEMSNDKVTIWVCMGCGFTSNTTITDGNVEQMESTLPELYKALKYKDQDGKYWYPNSVMLEDKSMVFAEGTSVDDWKWSAVQSKDGKADMTTKQEFAERDFMDALEYIGYFNQK
jgi:Zn ribbon nucleic-acid-binding protein